MRRTRERKNFMRKTYVLRIKIRFRVFKVVLKIISKRFPLTLRLLNQCTIKDFSSDKHQYQGERREKGNMWKIPQKQFICECLRGLRAGKVCFDFSLMFCFPHVDFVCLVDTCWFFSLRLSLSLVIYINQQFCQQINYPLLSFTTRD